MDIQACHLNITTVIQINTNVPVLKRTPKINNYTNFNKNYIF